MWEALNTISLSICRTMCELSHLLAHSISMSSSVANRLPRNGSLNLGMRSKSQGEVSGEWGGCSNSSHHEHRSSCRAHSVLCCFALSCRIIALSPRSVHLPRTPRRTYTTKKSLSYCGNY
ncbi:uncharacterized protein TNCT_323731 [Trichonephila clavata]|uniref:Uncharacterized protein n=1 Tax=Trichonephila clavata TaxID=2740835 RepID=A0A8X6KTD5_TRICU|nr:uncharacterized protein TNCT_323731 [Trichonephila clavata]